MLFALSAGKMEGFQPREKGGEKKGKKKTCSLFRGIKKISPGRAHPPHVVKGIEREVNEAKR